MTIFEKKIEVELDSSFSCSHITQPLFKYISSEFATNFAFNGIIKIGTLYDFRKEELYGNRIGDQNEGKQTYFKDTSRNPLEFNSRYQDKFTKDFIDTTKSDVKVVFKDIIFQTKLLSPNYYTLCLSSKLDSKLYPEFNASTCIIIADVTKFIELVSKRISDKADLIGLFKCHYIPEESDPDNVQSCHPAITKGLIFKPQNEYKIIWKPKDKNPQPFITKECDMSECI